MELDTYQGREWEHRGRRQYGPPESFVGPEAARTDNAPEFGNERRSRRDSSEGILGIGKPRERRLCCRQSNR